MKSKKKQKPNEEHRETKQESFWQILRRYNTRKYNLGRACSTTIRKACPRTIQDLTENSETTIATSEW